MIKVLLNGHIKTLLDTKVFSGGEVHVKLHTGNIIYHDQVNRVHIEACIRNSEDVMRLLMVKDAIKRQYGDIEVSLTMPYLPYARQDRVCDKGEAWSLKVFCELINNMNFKKVAVLDCHSPIGLALLKNVTHTSQAELIHQSLQGILKSQGYDFVIAPDLGAHKKAEEVAEALDLRVVQATKRRDPTNGKLSGFKIYEADKIYKGKCLIVDDICDGGGTFIGLTQELYAAGAASVDLFVTHGIFSKGLDCLHSAGIGHVYTTNSFTNLTSTDKLTVVNII